MVKKIFALVMVMSIVGGILAGCSGGAAEGEKTDAAATGTDAAKTDDAAK